MKNPILKIIRAPIIISSLVLSLAALGAGDNKATDETSKNKTGQRPTETNTIPVYVGQNVLLNLMDVREKSGDLINALKDAGATFGYAKWKDEKTNLNGLENKVEQIQKRLDHKDAYVNDNDWYTYYNTPDFGTTVHQTTYDLGEILTTIANGMKGGSKTTQKMPIAVADDVVEQVDDLRESVEDYIISIQQSGNRFYYYNWEKDRIKLDDYQKRLNSLEKRLDRKESQADEEWTAWFGNDVFKVTVHESIAELGSIMKSLAGSLGGKIEKTALSNTKGE